MAFAPSIVEYPRPAFDLASVSPSSRNPIEKRSSKSLSPVTGHHDHTRLEQSAERNSSVPINPFAQSDSHSPPHLAPAEAPKTSLPGVQNPESSKDSPSSPVVPQSAPTPDPTGWVDPLLLSPLTPSSQGSPPSWVDPLEDWNGTLPEAPENWVDPLIDNPLSSKSSSASFSSLQQHSPDPQSEGSPSENATKKRKRSSHSASSADKSYHETPFVASSNMPGDGHKGKNEAVYCPGNNRLTRGSHAEGTGATP